MIAETIGGLCRVLAGATAYWQSDAEAGRPRVYFANHASHLDFVMIWSSLPRRARGCVRPVAGMDYWTSSPIRRLVSEHVFHAVLIDRGRMPGHRGARTAIGAMAAALDKGQSLIVFPEGTRSRAGSIGTFKSGLYHLSRLRPDVELVPVLLENTHRVLPKGEVLPVPMLTRVVFGAPLRAEAAEGKAAFLTRARGALLDLGGCHGRTH
jgi:1-acyl-sn-glycerol-3-phosphate acyltransferase